MLVTADPVEADLLSKDLVVDVFAVKRDPFLGSNCLFGTGQS